MARRAGRRIPYASGAITAAGGEGTTALGRELSSENGAGVAADAVRLARHGLHAEHGLRLGGERHRRLERVCHAMLAQQTEEVGGELIDDEVGARYVDAESVRREVFTMALEKCIYLFAQGPCQQEADALDLRWRT